MSVFLNMKNKIDNKSLDICVESIERIFDSAFENRISDENTGKAIEYLTKAVVSIQPPSEVTFSNSHIDCRENYTETNNFLDEAETTVED